MMKAKILMTGAVALLLAPTLAAAAPTTNTSGANHANGPTVTTGQPGADCETLVATGKGSTPGGSATAPGSAFNPDGNAGTKYAGEQPQNTVNSATSSQYDVGCLHGTRSPQ